MGKRVVDLSGDRAVATILDSLVEGKRMQEAKKEAKVTVSETSGEETGSARTEGRRKAEQEGEGEGRGKAEQFLPEIPIDRLSLDNILNGSYPGERAGEREGEKDNLLRETSTDSPTPESLGNGTSTSLNYSYP
ncbi:MAG: hypothetical protein MMC33_003358 [Icmadophila ericetorum]|nr:hypothetical protein [Icmadophila ericetorum]